MDEFNHFHITWCNVFFSRWWGRLWASVRTWASWAADAKETGQQISWFVLSLPLRTLFSIIFIMIDMMPDSWFFITISSMGNVVYCIIETVRERERERERERGYLDSSSIHSLVQMIQIIIWRNLLLPSIILVSFLPHPHLHDLNHASWSLHTILASSFFYSDLLDDDDDCVMGWTGRPSSDSCIMWGGAGLVWIDRSSASPDYLIIILILIKGENHHSIMKKMMMM